MSRRGTESSGAIPGDIAISVGHCDMPAPPGWEWIRLTELARLETGHTPSRQQSSYWDGGIPWIGIKDARHHHGKTVVNTFQTVTQAGLDNSAARLLPLGTVCLSRTASIGYVTVMGQPMATSQDFVNWVCGPTIDPKFLMHLLICENAALHRFSKGSTHSTIYFPEVESFRVCLPPLNEQRRIVAKLEDLLARSRRAKDALDAIPPLLEKLRQSILAAAFRGDLTADWRAKNPEVEPAEELLKRIRIERRKKWEEAELTKLHAKGKAPTDDRWKAKYKEPEPVDASELPELPEGWCWASVSELGIVESGQTPSGVEASDARGSDFRWFRVGDMNLPGNEESLIHGGLGVSTAAGRHLGLHVRPTGTMVFPKRGGAIATNKKRLLAAPSAFDLNLMGIVPVEPAAGLLWWWLQSLDLAQFNDGTAVPQINHGDIAPLPVPLPTMTEAELLCRRVADATAVLKSLRSSHALAQTRTEELDRAILSKAFRGELVEQDPDDEPASVMLKRLAAERQAAQAAPTSSKRSPRRKARA